MVFESKLDIGMRDAQLQNIQNMDEKMITDVFSWMRSGKDFLVFLGLRGSGKTYFCSAMRNYFLEQKKATFYVKGIDFKKNLHDAIEDPGKSWEHEIRIYSQQPILIMDDFLHEKATEWEINCTFELIDQRCDNRLPTLLTSNSLVRDLKDVTKFTARLSSRILAARNYLIEMSDSIDLRGVYGKDTQIQTQTPLESSITS